MGPQDLVYPHFAYGTRLWRGGRCTKERFRRLYCIDIRKKSVRIIRTFSYILDLGESSRDVLRVLGLLTLLCIYVFELIMIMYRRWKFDLIGLQGSSVYQYGIKGRDRYRA